LDAWQPSAEDDRNLEGGAQVPEQDDELDILDLGSKLCVLVDNLLFNCADDDAYEDDGDIQDVLTYEEEDASDVPEDIVEDSHPVLLEPITDSSEDGLASTFNVSQLIIIAARPKRQRKIPAYLESYLLSHDS
jgi:hypothetical protein